MGGLCWSARSGSLEDRGAIMTGFSDSRPDGGAGHGDSAGNRTDLAVDRVGSGALTGSATPRGGDAALSGPTASGAFCDRQAARRVRHVGVMALYTAR